MLFEDMVNGSLATFRFEDPQGRIVLRVWLSAVHSSWDDVTEYQRAMCESIGIQDDCEFVLATVNVTPGEMIDTVRDVVSFCPWGGTSHPGTEWSQWVKSFFANE